MTISTPLRRVPPSREQLSEALSRLTGHDSRRAAFHLALPVDAVDRFSVRRTVGTWVWRDVSTAHADPVDAACALAALGWCDDDRFVDLSADPVTWLKPIRSGAQIIVFGLDTLFGLPLLSVPARMGEQAALGIATDMVRTGVTAGEIEVGDGARLRLEPGIGCVTGKIVVT